MHNLGVETSAGRLSNNPYYLHAFFLKEILFNISD